MPKEIVDYSNTIIYKIYCKNFDITDIYVGHTTNFIKRKALHKSQCNNLNNKVKIYETIRQNGGWSNWDMIEIEKYPCNDSNEAGKRERYWYELNHTTLNTKVPNRTFDEYINDILEYKRLKQREYSKLNRDIIREKAQVKINCECGCVVNNGGYKVHLMSKKHLKHINSI
jgi:hypothetical protein